MSRPLGLRNEIVIPFSHPKMPRCLIAGQAAPLNRFYNALSQAKEIGAPIDAGLPSSRHLESDSPPHLEANSIQPERIPL